MPPASPAPRRPQKPGWLVYLLRCRDGALYCGITNDLPKRLKSHAAGKASRYTRSRLPVRLAYTEPQRSATRVRWFEDPTGHTYGSYSMEAVECDLPLPPSVRDEALPYPEDAKPIFVGHYWLKGPRPELLRQNIACVDWSVAKGGFLCAYRWDGERELDQGKFVWIG